MYVRFWGHKQTSALVAVIVWFCLANADITPWADRVKLVDARCVGTWELPMLGAVPAPDAVLIRPDGYVAWVGDLTQLGLADALTTWFGPPAAA